MKDLKPCPFCGKTETLRIVTAAENEEYKENQRYVCVCCDSTNGGCGACSGYCIDQDKAIDQWNKRN